MWTRALFLFYSGSNAGRHTYGTGFLVPTNLLENVIRFEAISDRLCMIRVRGKFFNISIVNAYAPTEDADEDIKDKFYDHLETVYEQLPGYDAKIVVGDFNAKIGREDIFIPTIGKHSKHNTSNDNGVRLISFASSKGMVVKSTMFPHKEIYKGTWKSPDGKTVNQIDHVLIDDRHKNTIQDVRSYRGADCDSDHYMLGIKIKSKIKKSGKEAGINTEIIDVDILQDELIREKFNIELNNRFQNLTVDEDVDKAWENVRNTVKEVAISILGKKKKRKKRKWWNSECDNIIEEKKKFKVLAEQSTKFNNRYMELQKEAKQIIRKAKRQHLDNLVKTMETLIRAHLLYQGSSRQFYQELKSYKKGYQPVTQMLEDEDGNLITNKTDIKVSWHNYFQQLLNCTQLNVPIPQSKQDNVVNIEPLSFKEVQQAIMRLRNNKAPGIDGLPSEIWKYGGGTLQSRLYEVLRKIWDSEKQPQEWNMAIICPIHKERLQKEVHELSRNSSAPNCV
ncbi:unnamed protein product [Colias eurytheme]|nr:unnamed protein product [Colias eurytheme]